MAPSAEEKLVPVKGTGFSPHIKPSSRIAGFSRDFSRVLISVRARSVFERLAVPLVVMAAHQCRFVPVRCFLRVIGHILGIAPPGDEFCAGGSSSFLGIGLCQQRSALKAWVYRSFHGYAELSFSSTRRALSRTTAPILSSFSLIVSTCASAHAVPFRLSRRSASISV